MQEASSYKPPKRELRSTSPPRGMRDCSPQLSRERAHLRHVLAERFLCHGFEPLETSAMEQTSTLVGQYGEESEQLIFHVLNSGDYLSGLSVAQRMALAKALTTDEDTAPLAEQLRSQFCEKALRYDLTLPLARYVAKEATRLPMPFRRYQMQAVWRADRPQKGRYREFYQCDADIIGSNSLLCELEMLLLIHDIFNALGLSEVCIRVNHRALLTTLAIDLGAEQQKTMLFTALDKIDKIGIQGLERALAALSFTPSQIERLHTLLATPAAPCSAPDRLKQLTTLLPAEDQTGYQQLATLFNMLAKLKPALMAPTKLQLDLSLARGLTYYTGLIFEVVHPSARGSLLGGGRYDHLTAHFSKTKLPGIGLSFGLDRIHELMANQGLLAQAASPSTQALVIHLGPETLMESLNLTNHLRAASIPAEHYHTADKVKKQLAYADRKNIPYAIFAGPEELKQGRFNLRSLQNGQQETLTQAALLHKLQTTTAS